MSNSEVGTKIAAGALVCIGGTVLICLSFLYGIFSMGYVGMKLWSWFVVPVFALPALTWAQAYGISMLVKLWTYSPTPSSKEDKLNFAAVIFYPWITLLFAWFVKLLFI